MDNNYIKLDNSNMDNHMDINMVFFYNYNDVYGIYNNVLSGANILLLK